MATFADDTGAVEIQHEKCEIRNGRNFSRTLLGSQWTIIPWERDLAVAAGSSVKPLLSVQVRSRNQTRC